MTVIIFLLKIIGIILLVVVGLLLVILLSACFIPVRYEAIGNKKEDFSGEIRISWCKFVLCYIWEWKENQLQKKLKIFGIEWRGSKKTRDHQEKPSLFQKEKNRKKTKKILKTEESENQDFTAKDLRKQSSKEQPKEKEGVPKKNINKSEKSQKEDKKSKDKISDFFRMIHSKWENIKEKIKNIKTILRKIIAELKDPVNRIVVSVLWKELLYLLKKVKPQNLKGEISFSMGDPSLTGQIFGGICTIPFLYLYELKIFPDFQQENSYLEGYAKVEGRIFGIHILMSFIRLLKEKNIWIFIEKIGGSSDGK